MAPRLLVLFSRAPDREAREKGLAPIAGEELFEAFAAGWADAARRAGAVLVVASAPRDRGAWRRLLERERPLFVEQRGRSFGARLETSVRAAAALGGRTLVVGGDVVPSAADLARGFELLEEGVDSVVAPAFDGGVSVVGLAVEDLDLLGEMAPRRRHVFDRLCERLAARGRRVAIVAPAPDVDGRRSLGDLVSNRGLRPYAALLRRACARPPGVDFSAMLPPPRPPVDPVVLRGPPAA